MSKYIDYRLKSENSQDNTESTIEKLSPAHLNYVTERIHSMQDIQKRQARDNQLNQQPVIGGNFRNPNLTVNTNFI